MTTENKNSKTALLESIKDELTNVRLRDGEIVEAELIKKTPRGVFFDLGRFGTGIVYGVELSNARDIIKKLDIGGKISARVETTDGEGGYIELSLAEAGKQKLWHQVQELQESGEVVKVKITGSNQSGLLADLVGLKAFLPLSQLSQEHYPKAAEGDQQKSIDAIKNFIGQELGVKVIAVNPRTNKLIISERELLSVNVKELLTAYKVGQDVDGIVSGIADFGIFVRFVDNPQIEGLVHISEVEHRIIDNPKEVVTIDQPVKVRIIDIKEGRVFLSMKVLKADPWQDVASHFKAGQEVTGTVYKFNPFGAVIELDKGIQGLIHISEFGGADEMKKVLVPKESKQFVIDSVKPEEKRIILKMKK
ncbi:MAG TPA: S1 RNA-binding domain-containing protein [Candidatus Paceibacterota bacterium]|nr:S1 RNA-binding domain-containing protein [Candidatus Paceibacterota bacterium]